MRQTFKAKIAIFLVGIIFLFFFSSDFGLIDVEKTSIITAIAIDKAENSFEVTAQIAVPEAIDTNSENLKAQLTGKGSTVAGALKDLGDVSGWFPKLAFCNLILLGSSLATDNVLEALDYFAKTLRVQDSALVALCEKDAKSVLSLSTPLDNISAFALQKVMFKTQGFDNDVASTDIKTFCASHYSKCSAGFMPIIKITPSGEEQSSNSSSSSGQNSSGQTNSSSQNDKKILFNARTTAIFKNGFKVGDLDEKQTLTFNMLTENVKGTTLSIDNVLGDDGSVSNYLLTIVNDKKSIQLTFSDKPVLVIKLTLYCKISDHAMEGTSEALSQNLPLPKKLKKTAEQQLSSDIKSLIQTSIKTDCDFLQLKEKLYRFNNKQYSNYKDNLLSKMDVKISVTVDGQK